MDMIQFYKTIIIVLASSLRMCNPALMESKKSISNQIQNDRILNTPDVANIKQCLNFTPLVRSNPEHQIGFLKEPERLTVLLTRAKEGMILIGNADCLRNSKNKNGAKLWNQLLTSMDEHELVFDGLPAICASHKRENVLKTKEDFTMLAQNGGCSLECSRTMPCGHNCPLRCHSFPCSSDNCPIGVPVTCRKGHVTFNKCHQVFNKSTFDDCSTCNEIQRLRKQKEAEIAKIRQNEASLKKQRDMEQAVEEERLQKVKDDVEKEDQLMKELFENEKIKIDRMKKEHELRLRQENRNEILEQQIAAEVQAAEKEMLQKELEAEKKFKKLTDEIKRKRDEMQNTKKKQDQEFSNRRMAAELLSREGYKKILDKNATNEDVIEKSSNFLAHFLKILNAKESKECLTLRKSLLAFLKEQKLDSCTREILSAALGNNFAIKISNVLKNASSTDNFDATKSPSVKRALDLLNKGKWLPADEVLSNDESNSEVKLLSAIIRLHLSQDDQTIIQGKTLLRYNHENMDFLQHLLEAIIKDAEVSGKPSRNCLAYSLLTLLHSDIGSFPFSQDVVLTLIRKHIPSLNADQLNSKISQSKATRESEWTQKAMRSPSLKELLKLTGLANIKDSLFSMADRIELDQKRGLNPKEQPFNIRFDGNPGTGKTTVARIYAKFLKEKKILKEGNFEETSGSKLVNGGTAELTKILKKLESGGVLFIDEAYQLNPKTNSIGAQVLDMLLPEMENKRDSLVVVMAGYEKQMDDLMAHNEGLPSRFPYHFTFEDYSDDELLTILKGIIKEKEKFAVSDEKFTRIAIKRLGRQRGTVGFGNARAVRNLFQRTLNNQASRIIQEQKDGKVPNEYLIERDDLLGPKYIDRQTCPALEELTNMRGLNNVKQTIDQLLQLVQTNVELEENEKPIREVTLNRIFLGNPGTGKTTVAKLYGKILKSLGMLSKGDVIVKNPQDFVGQVLGESEAKTKKILDNAKGSVLVIDEAYGLHSSTKSSDPYKVAVIDTIVAEVQGVPGDDRCVLMLGYKEQMEDMIRNANPGLARRFNMADAFTFDDYSDEDLLWILLKKAEKEKLPISFDTAKFAIKILSEQRRLPNFGNAGAINNLLSRAVQNMQSRLTEAGASAAERAESLMENEDFLSEEKRAALNVNIESLFEGLIGLEAVKDQVNTFTKTIKFSYKLGREPLDDLSLNYVFSGSPGTGKTTIARIMGKLLASLNLLGRTDVVECSASDFVTGFTGQAGNKTRELFRSALGGVLFIDEAYRLNPKKSPGFMQEVVDEIVQILTEKQFKNKMAVIFAGYEQDMIDLFEVNPGLKSRIPNTLKFDDFSVEDSSTLLNLRLKGKSLALTDEAQSALKSLLSDYQAAPHWSNGRDVETLADRIYQEQAKSIAENSDDSSCRQIPLLVLEKAISSCISMKGKKITKEQSPNPFEGLKFATANDSNTTTEPKVTTASSKKEELDNNTPDVQIEKDDDVKNHFLDIPIDFLEDLTENMEQLNITDPQDAVNFDIDILSKKLIGKGRQNDLVLDLLRQWRKAMLEAIEQQKRIEEEIARKIRSRRPVWRCAACGSPGCPFAPYIYGYQDIDTGEIFNSKS